WQGSGGLSSRKILAARRLERARATRRDQFFPTPPAPVRRQGRRGARRPARFGSVCSCLTLIFPSYQFFSTGLFDRQMIFIVSSLTWMRVKSSSLLPVTYVNGMEVASYIFEAGRAPRA